MPSSHVGERGHTVAFECFAAAQTGTGPDEWSMTRGVSHCTTNSSHVLPRCPAAVRGTYLMDGSAHTATSASGPLPVPGVIELWMRATGKPSPPRGFAEPCQCPCSTSQADNCLAAAALSTTQLSSLVLISMLFISSTTVST